MKNANIRTIILGALAVTAVIIFVLEAIVYCDKIHEGKEMEKRTRRDAFLRDSIDKAQWDSLQKDTNYLHRMAEIRTWHRQRTFVLVSDSDTLYHSDTNCTHFVSAMRSERPYRIESLVFADSMNLKYCGQCDTIERILDGDLPDEQP